MAKLTREDVKQIVLTARNKYERPNLSGMDLSDVDLSGMSFNRANLTEANLRNTNLIKTDFTIAYLAGTNLNYAKLVSSNLSGADLSRADLSGADLRGTILSGVSLREANLNQAVIGYTTFGQVDLSTVKGLDTMSHDGPSTIGIDTLQLSKISIPEVFLRGCGLNDAQIEMAKLHDPNLTQDQIVDITYKISTLLSGNVIKYYSCFISYSSQDETFAQRLHADLQQKGVRCWFAPEDMKIGDKIRPTIDQSIRVHDKLLIVLSENSLNSEWVESEVEKAFEEERKRKQTVLFPVRLDEAVMETEESWAAEIRRTRHIGDFSRWKDHDAYQQAFERLLRDLKAEG